MNINSVTIPSHPSISVPKSKFTVEEIELMRIDYNYQQIIHNLPLENIEDVEQAMRYLKEWFVQDELCYVHEIITKIEKRMEQLNNLGNDDHLALHIKQQLDSYQVQFNKIDYDCIMKSKDIFEQVQQDSSNWSKFIDGEDLKIWYRK